ncbi:unnamed protein product, partial [Durusdinium trenchii]
MLRNHSLSYNQIGAEGGVALAKALETNQTLQKLGLSNNNIDTEGGVALAKALETNQTLTTLVLQSNQIGAEGGVALGKALETNQTLQVLRINYNSIPANIASDIRAKVGRNLANPQPKPQPRKNNRKELEQHYRAAVQNGDLQEWGRSKVMVIGQGEAGKTSSVQSLLGMPPAPTESTVGMDLKVTRASDWQERPAEESDFDFV